MHPHPIPRPGISNIPSPSSHRLPAVSAAKALLNLKSSPTRCISTGLTLLDCVLQNRELVVPNIVKPVPGGISRGKVTEVYGPPGVGKTALGMQLAASVLHAGEGVIWVDASHPIPGARFAQILNAYQPLIPPSSPRKSPSIFELAENITHFSTPTLAHLIALLTNPTPTHPPPNTALIVIDSFSTLLSNAYPKNDAKFTARKPGAPHPIARKSPIVQYIINALQKLAATRNIAIVIFSQCMTKMRTGLGAALVPAISTTTWEYGIGCRIALFRDWGWEDGDGRSIDDVRLAQVIKAEGVAASEGRSRLVGFSISQTGLIPLTLPTRQKQSCRPALSPQSPLPTNGFASSVRHAAPATLTPNGVPQKRKFDAATLDLEIPDSDAEDDEDYGWGEEDEEVLPPLPPQWQGSEDILIPDPAERDLAGDVDTEADDECGLDGDAGAAEAEAEAERMERVIEDSEDELA